MREQGANLVPPVLGHNPRLDGIRGLAILLVMVHHFSTILVKFDGPVDAVVRAVVGSLWCGVDLFFVLSGFLITGILVRTKGQSGWLRTFFARRFLRIFPLYYGALAIYAFVLPAFGVNALGNAPQAWLWLHGANFMTVLHGWGNYCTSHLWSLAIEEQFYLVWPFIVLLVPARRLPWAILALMLAAMVCRAIVPAYTRFGYVGNYVLPFTRMDSLFAGALLASALHSGPAVLRRTAFWRAVMLVALPVVLYLAWGPDGLNWKKWRPVWQVFGYSALALTFVSLIALVGAARPESTTARLFESSLLVRFGKYSYAMYLFHLPLQKLSWWCLWTNPGSMPRFRGTLLLSILVQNVCLIGLTFAAGWLSYHLYEKHFLKLKERIGNRPIPGADETAPCASPSRSAS